MKNLFKKTAMIAALGFSLSSHSSKVGTAAPDFELKDQNGKTHKLSSFKGKHVVLEWLNHECPFVKKHYDAGNMQAIQKEATAKGAVWLSINSSAEGLQGHLTASQAKTVTDSKKASPTAVLLDPTGTVGKAYDAKVTPHMYIIDPSGTLVYNGAIDDKPSTKIEDVKGAKNFVMQALAESMAGKKVSNASNKPYGCSVKYN